MNISKKEDSILIRDINKNDAMDLFKFLRGFNEKTKSFFHPHSFDLKTVNNICKSKKDHYFVMFFNNKLVGYSFLRLFGYKIPSYGVIIKNHYRARGFGTILSKWTIDKAREFGYNKVILKTYKENISAKKIYEKLGFKIVGETEDKKQFKMEIIL
jgi:RimJ/RimL family protein N-acetyltransferase